ncbi:hypothetical protein GCM10023205_67220 [Yinghuangia aomiensis]|uniref:GH16 domain-containing protein n=2 Tax=Yinghuangia aomiensis TaxID=676205 RepID=A0ABP9I407_9ACTN
MSRRAIHSAGDGGTPPPRRTKWWGVAVATVVLVSAPIIIVANAVSGGGRHNTGRTPQHVAERVDHPGWQSYWFDEFDGTELDAGKWMTCLSGYDTTKPCKGPTNGEQQKYTPAQVTVSDGSLHLAAERKPVDGLPFSSGAVSTDARAGEPLENSRALFSPGVYIEARVRLARGVAMRSAMSLTPMVPQEPHRPEIDVFEFGGEQSLAQARLHAAGPCRVELGEVRSADECYGELTRASNYFVDDYRIFGVNWQDDKLTYYADGKPILTVVGDAVPRERMYLIFNLAVGGIMGGDTRHAPDSAAMSVDYVRAWRGSGEAPVGAANDGNGANPKSTVSGASPTSATPSTTPSTSAPPAGTTASPSAGQPTHSTAAATPAPPPAVTSQPAQSGEPWLEVLAPAAGSTVSGTITVTVRVHGDLSRVQEVSFYVNEKNCSSPKVNAVWVGYDVDMESDGLYSYKLDTRRLSNGCNTISTNGVDIENNEHYWPQNRLHVNVNVAN